MKYGIYYSYWESEWGGDSLLYIEKIARLGFDLVELPARYLYKLDDAGLAAIRESAKRHGVVLTAGLGPPKDQCLASPDEAVRRAGRDYFKQTLTALAKLDIHAIGGALYSHWPIDYSQPVDKAADRARGIEDIRVIADFARDLGINLCMEVLNRFENHVLNTAAEGVAFVEEVGKPNVKVMLDTFHMNIEEDSFGQAIRTAGRHLGHFHIGENNRRVPGKGHIPWSEIAEALRDIGYQGTVVMEPFVKTGGTIGQDIRVWRDLSGGASEAQLDEDARAALGFCRYVLG